MVEHTATRRSFDVWNEVPLVAQTTGMSCWAAAAAMLLGWRESLAVNPGDVALGAGRWNEFKNGLHPEDVAAFAERWGLVAEQSDDVWNVDRFYGLLKRFGPLWVGEASPGLHAIVVTGLYGDGTPNGSHVRVNDPWPVDGGERYTISFSQLRENFEAASRLAGDRAHILHSGGRGASGFRRSEERVSRHVQRTERTRIGDIMNRYGRGVLIDAVESLEVRGGDRYIDTTRVSPDPLAGHGGTGENLYLAWNAIPDDATAVDVVVHLHGFSSLDPNRGMLERKLAASGLDLGGRLRPTLAILPRGRKITAAEIQAETKAGKKPNPERYTFPALMAQQGSGLEQLIQMALSVFGRAVLGGRAVARARLILTAHSGAGQAVEALVGHRTVRAVCNPHELHIYDALYSASPNIAGWVRDRVRDDQALVGQANSEAALARDGGGCRIIYGSGTQANSVDVSRAFPPAGALKTAYRAESTRVAHGDIPGVFGRALLTSVRADLILVPARAKAQAVVRPLDFDEAVGFAVDDDARTWLTADEAARSALAANVRSWILATDRSALELLPDPARRRHFVNEVNWQHHDFPGEGSNRAVESVAMFNALERVVPERRVNTSATRLTYHDVFPAVKLVPENGNAALFPEAKDAFVRMRTAAKADGVNLIILSGYRSQQTQDRIKAHNSNRNAVAQGISSHTYGLAVDLAMKTPERRTAGASTKSMPELVAMYQSPEYKWMALKARRFGWFPYRAEPWHWEYNPEGFKARFESRPAGGALTYGAPTGLFDRYAPSESLDDPKSRRGHAIPRARVSDALGNKVLDLLWEEIAEDDVPRMRDRLKRLDGVLARLSPAESCALLDRLGKGGGLKRDFDYRLSRPSRQRIRRELRTRCQAVIIKPPIQTQQPSLVPEQLVPKPPEPKVVPPPPPTPRPGLNVVGTFELESKPKRLKRVKYFSMYAALKVAGNASVNANDAALSELKLKWAGKKFRPELQSQLDSAFVPDLKIEATEEGPLVSFKKGITTGPVKIDANFQLRFWEPIKVEVLGPKMSTSVTLAGQRFEIDFTPEVDLLVRIEWLDIAKEGAKKSARGFWEALKSGLKGLIGGLFGSMLEDAIIVLAGAIIAKLLIDPDEDEPVEVLPEDVSGFEEALKLANAGRSSPLVDDRFERAATEYRRTFATGFGDTLAELTKATWAARLQDLKHPRQVRSFVRLPATSADRDWIAFSLGAGKHGLESVDLYTDDFVARFRIAEKAWMFAVAAHSRGTLNAQELTEARQTATQQATVAGMAAAVQHLRNVIGMHTFEFVDENRQLQKREGQDAWMAVVEVVREMNLPHKVVQDRLAQLAVDHLPVLKIK